MNTNASPPEITANSQKLCSDYHLHGNYANPLYHGVEFRQLLARLSDQNEARVVRDLTPMIMPSAEHLHILGDEDLLYLTEELNTEWTKCNSLAGPRPKPDCAAGLKPSAFTEEEILKLKVYTAPSRIRKHSVHALLIERLGAIAIILLVSPHREVWEPGKGEDAAGVRERNGPDSGVDGGGSRFLEPHDLRGFAFLVVDDGNDAVYERRDLVGVRGVVAQAVRSPGVVLVDLGAVDRVDLLGEG
ncbi:MAG: hypothetical protein Q9177_000043 [Variospora cf. flavescens]